MGLAEMFLGADNPFAQWVGQNQNLIGAVAGGLGQGQNIQSGLSAGMAQIPQAKALDYEAAAKRKADALALEQANLTTKWLNEHHPEYAHLPPEEGFKMAMQAEAAKYKSGGAGGSFETGYTPIWGQNDGNPAIALPGNDGKLYINGQPVDPTKFVPTNPYDLNAQKAGGSAFGKATGGAQFSMPQVENELAQSLSALQKLSEPDITAGKDEWFNQAGALPRGMWVQGGTNMAKFRNTALNIIDRSWLSARAALKGAGQITDYEGAKAENAVSMMKAALDSGDKASYDAAVAEYEYWIKQGFAKMQQQAGGLPGYGADPTQAAPAGAPDLKSKYGLE